MVFFCLCFLNNLSKYLVWKITKGNVTFSYYIKMLSMTHQEKTVNIEHYADTCSSKFRQEVL